MSIHHTSDFIFSLADKYQIRYKDNNPSQFPDENYDAFCKEYLELSKGRDAALKTFLINNPNRVRTFLPWRAYIFDTVLQLQWYYDELVVYDPIFFQIVHFKTDDIEHDKARFRELLIFLNSLKDSITEGFLLFGSYDSFPENQKAIEENKFENLLSIPEIQEECVKIPLWFKMEGSDGIEKSYYNMRGYYRNKQTFFTVLKDIEKIKLPEGGASIYYDFTGKHVAFNLEEIKNAKIFDRCFDAFKEDYPSEIAEVLRYIEIAPAIKTPVLFNRKLDELIISNISAESKLPDARANNYYNLILPFVNGIPCEKLLDVRMNMPEAFVDFRNAMFDVISEIQKGEIDQALLEIKIKQKINPILKKLDAEIKSSLTKAKILGLGVPLVSGIGTLGLLHFGIDPSKFANVLLGGMSLAELTALTSYINESRSSKTSDFYYLWKVKQ